MPQATYPIKKFADLRMYIAADMFRYMTSTSAKAFLRAWYIAGLGIHSLCAAVATTATDYGIGLYFCYAA
ncbi:unknown [Prevotella sp. CAG:873]|nr:unknown [Prevotella sp. CAG:873]